MSLIVVEEYWPFFCSSEKRRFDYVSIINSAPDSAADPFTAIYSYDSKKKSMILSEYSKNGILINKWYYKSIKGFGVAEWRDDTRYSYVVYSEPIGWGHIVNIGEQFFNRPRMCPYKSWPPKLLSGRQIVNFETLHSTFTTQNGSTYYDVLQFSYLQSWGAKGRIGGARYWMAKGIGPIALQWIAEIPKGSGIYLECLPLEAKICKIGGPENI